MNSLTGFIKKYPAPILFCIGLLLYSNTLTHDFVMDDAIVITENVYTQQGVSGIPGILKHDTFHGFFQDESKADLVAGGRYRPFTLIMFAIEYEIFGENPFIGHLINVLLYGLTCALMFLLFQFFFKRIFKSEKAFWAAFMGALIFAIHPLHTEAVANIKGRDEIMALLGSIAAFYFLLKSKKRDWANWLLVFALFSAALFSKENAIVFIAAVPLYFFMFEKKGVVSALKVSSPFLVAALVFLIIRQSVLGIGLGGDPPMELMNNPFLKWDGSRYIPFDFSEKAATILVILLHYLKLTVLPYPMTHDYYPRQIEVYSLSDILPWISFLLIVFLVYKGLKDFRSRPVLSYGLIFFAMALFPYTNILFPIGTNLSERFLYTPTLGFSLIFGWALMKYTSFPNKSGLLLKTGVLALIIIFSGLTFNRNFAWKDNYTLFMTDIKTSDRSAKLHNAVAGELSVRAAQMETSTVRTEKLERSLFHSGKALEIHPRYKNAWLLRGNAFYYLKRFEEAVDAYQNAIRLDANYVDALRNIGVAYRDGGRYFGEQEGNIVKALEFLNEAEKYLPNDYETMRLLGVANGVSGNNEKAVFYFTKAAELEPNDSMAWLNLGIAYFNSGDNERGEKYRSKAIEMDPDIIEKAGNQ